MARQLQFRESMQITRVGFLVCLAGAAVITIGCNKNSGSSPTTPTPVVISNPGAGVKTYTYTTNIQPILTDCLPCHGPTIQNGTYNFSTYAGVLRALVPGSDQSRIVQMTQPNGAMYLNMSGDRFAKSGIIYDWVVNSNAAQ